MGVAGLWEVLRPAGEVRSLTELAVTHGFIDNPSGQRGFRIGIDASIWFFHAANGREGENPELRTLFFRCCRLLQTPLLPLFVFDGPKRPAIKRGKRVGGNAHWLTTGMKNMIQAFGFECRTAPGEAEAELAYLNSTGVIDAVLSDDVDNFLFGATMVIRNPSNTLSGNRSHPVKNAAGKDDGNHVLTYRASELSTHPSVQLTRSGTILIALLSGGDYIPAGLPGCGKAFATGLARAGFGDTLVNAVATTKGRELEEFLDRWREDVRKELCTNKSGLLPTKKPSLASSLTATFPSLPVLLSYVSPITSETERLTPSPVRWPNDPDPKQIAALCELYFEWGVKDVIVKRFRTVLWPGVVCRAIRRAVLEGDITRRDNHHLQRALSPPSNQVPSTSASSSQPDFGQAFNLTSLVPVTAIQLSPSSSRSSSPMQANQGHTEDPPLVTALLSSRTHASTDSTLEYRALIDPTSLVRRAEAGVRGIRPPLESGLFGTAVDSEGEDDSVAINDIEESDDDTGHGDIDRLETTGAAKKRATKTTKNAKKSTPVTPTTPLRIWIPACMLRAAAPGLVEAYEVRELAKRTKKKGKASARGTRAKEGRDGQTDITTKADKVNKSTSRTTTRGTSAGARRRKPKHTSEVQDEAYEVFNLSAASSCSSDESIDGARKTRNLVEKGKAKEAAKAPMKEKPAPTVKSFFRTKKPLATSTSIAKPKASTLTSISTSKTRPLPLYDDDDEKDEPPSAPSLAQSARPLDLVRSKINYISKCTVAAKPRSTLVYEEEEESSSSSPPSVRRTSVNRPTTLEKILSLDVGSDDDVEVSDVRSGACSSTGDAGTSSNTRGSADGLRHTKHPPATKSGSKLAHIRLPSNTEEESSEQEGDALRASRRYRSRPNNVNDKAGSGNERFKPELRPFPMPSPSKPHSSPPSTTDDFATSRHVSSPRSPVPWPSETGAPKEGTDHVSNQPSSKPLPRVYEESHNDFVPKSHRKSTSHTSPRHVCGSPSSPTSPSSVLDWRDLKTTLASTVQGPRESKAASSSASGSASQRKSEPIIYISSDSEDDIVGDADTAMILSSAPALPQPSRAFMYASAKTLRGEKSTSGEGKASLSVASTSHTARTGTSSILSAPLLVARAKKASINDTAGSGRSSVPFSPSKPAPSNPWTKMRAKTRLVSSEDIIDLTSDG